MEAVGDKDKREIKMRERRRSAVDIGRDRGRRRRRRVASGSHTEGIPSSCCCRETRVGEQIRTAQGKRHTAFSDQIAENIKVKANKAVADSAFYDIKWQLNEGYLKAGSFKWLLTDRLCPRRRQKEEKKTQFASFQKKFFKYSNRSTGCDCTLHPCNLATFNPRSSALL